MPQLSPWVRPKFFDTASFAPLAGGRLYTYVSGTTTAKTTWSDSAGSSANANPVILDAQGECDLWLATDAEYRFELRKSDDVTVLWVRDNVKPGSYTDLENTSNAALGDALVGVKLVDVNSIGTTQHQVNEETVSVFRWFTAAQIADVLAGTFSLDLVAAIGKAVDYCVSHRKNLFHPAGGYLLSSYYPVRDPDPNPSALKSYNNIHIFGEGRSTIIRTTFPGDTGADVFQLNGVQDVVIRDLAVTGTKSAPAEPEDHGVNGVSITGGGKNIKIYRVHAFDLPYFIETTVTKEHVDGSKGFTLQPGETTNTALVIEDIEIAYCSCGAGTSVSSFRPASGFVLSLSGPNAIFPHPLNPDDPPHTQHVGRAPKNIRVHHNYFDVWYRGSEVGVKGIIEGHDPGEDPYAFTTLIPGMEVAITDNHVYNAQYGHFGSRGSGVTVDRNHYVNTDSSPLTGEAPSGVPWDMSRIPIVSLGEYLCKYRGNTIYYVAATHFAKVGGGGTNGMSYHCEYSSNSFSGASAGDGFEGVNAGGTVTRNASFIGNAFANMSVAGAEYDALLRTASYQNIIIDDAFAQLKSVTVSSVGTTSATHILEIQTSTGTLKTAFRHDGQLALSKIAASAVSGVNGAMIVYDAASPSTVVGYIPIYTTRTP